jgi:phospholipid transport system substrate-binding protein
VLALLLPPAAARAETPAEALISTNIHKGLEILNDRQLSPAQRGARFESFLLGITDLKRVAVFALGDYGAKAPQGERDAFAAAFQNYAVAVYQSYLGKYAGQTLTVTGSQHVADGDDVVTTTLVDPAGGKPLGVDFRVRSNSGAPLIVDVGVEGVWLAVEEREQFTGFLKQNGGSLAALSAHLDALRLGLGAAQ